MESNFTQGPKESLLMWKVGRPVVDHSYLGENQSPIAHTSPILISAILLEAIASRRVHVFTTTALQNIGCGRGGFDPEKKNGTGQVVNRPTQRPCRIRRPRQGRSL